jgi:putative nucleotidyltransferase with HDIG domain
VSEGTATRAPVPSSVVGLISALASTTTAVLILSGPGAWRAAEARPVTFLSFLGLTFGLQLLTVDVYGRGAVSVAGVGILATGFAFGVGAAMAAGLFAALVLTLRNRVVLHRALFNAATFSLAAAAGSAVMRIFETADWGPLALFAAAALGGAAYWLVNIGLLCLAMSLSEQLPVLTIWRERFAWLTPHYVASGPLALACTTAYERLGFAGLLAFAVPPALMILSVQQYLSRTRAAVEEVRQANDELRQANIALGERNEDLRDLFEFAAGLAPHVHDRAELVAYAERWLSRLTGGDARIGIGRGSGGIPLTMGGQQVGTLSLGRSERFDERRWARLRDALLPQLATALESTALVEQVRKTYLATIAALSRTMEAKDDYTSGHTERVAGIAVALAERLGYSGSELEAIETGALLHDIGKVGVPEAILNKRARLDPEEWELVKKHPEISDYILSEVDLPAIVRQIARSSHERMDGNGYPDGLVGTEIPLPARIVSVADTWDALTSDRPYRSAFPPQTALDEVRSCTGTQFCPEVVAALERIYREEPRLLVPADEPAPVTHLRAIKTRTEARPSALPARRSAG